jgi:hypothetical protein
MQKGLRIKTIFLATVLVLAFMTFWEYHLRNRGFKPTFNDDKILWAATRNRINNEAKPATVIIGSSRIKFDLDLHTWKDLTGHEAIQLAMVGTSPRPVLRHLAADETFKGKLIIDVVEGLFFSPRTFISEKSARESIEYFESETPAQKTSGILDHQLESHIVFIEEAKFGLTNLLNDLQLPNRQGVFSFPSFPHEFATVLYNRQTVMTPMFLSNPELIKRQIGNWAKLGGLDKTPGIKGPPLEAVFKEVKECIDKIRARGGEVVFVRPPSSGGFAEAEAIAYPRAEYWDAMLTYTNTPGIHFEDYPTTANFKCPEWSHLHPDDVITYTGELVTILKNQMGWKFNGSPMHE